MTPFFPAAPQELLAKSQLRGLDKGEFLLQPKWDGRRAVAFPDGGLFYRSGKPINVRPWKEIDIPKTDFPLDLELFRDVPIVLDALIPGPTQARLEFLKELGQKRGDPRLVPMFYAVDSLAQVNEHLKRCLGAQRPDGQRLCDGVVLKRATSPYRWSPTAQVQEKDWLKVKIPLA